MSCGYCEDHGGALSGTAVDDSDTHLEAPCAFCGGNHAQVFCAKFNAQVGMEPLHGYEV